jgi:hypothetical protein
MNALNALALLRVLPNAIPVGCKAMKLHTKTIKSALIYNFIIHSAIAIHYVRTVTKF